MGQILYDSQIHTQKMAFFGDWKKKEPGFLMFVKCTKFQFCKTKRVLEMMEWFHNTVNDLMPLNCILQLGKILLHVFHHHFSREREKRKAGRSFQAAMR